VKALRIHPTMPEIIYVEVQDQKAPWTTTIQRTCLIDNLGSSGVLRGACGRDCFSRWRVSLFPGANQLGVMAKSKPWLRLIPDGLRQLLARKDPVFVLYEILQNAWMRIRPGWSRDHDGCGIWVRVPTIIRPVSGIRRAHTLFHPESEGVKYSTERLSHEPDQRPPARVVSTSTAGAAIGVTERPAIRIPLATLKAGVATGAQLRRGLPTVDPSGHASRPRVSRSRPGDHRTVRAVSLPTRRRETNRGNEETASAMADVNTPCR